MRFSALFATFCLTVGTCALTGSLTALPKETVTEHTINWMTNFAEAKALAKNENKPLFVMFSGSDWCPYCKRIDKEILKTQEFEDALADKMIFVLIDFPRSHPVTAEVKKQNDELSKTYQVRGFPTVLIFDADMNKIGTLGYASGGPAPFIKKVDAIIQK